MKKVLVILLAIVMLLPLIACGNVKDKETVVETKEEESDKNNPNFYLGTWVGEEYTLTFNKGGVGLSEVKNKNYNKWSFTYEVKDGVVVVFADLGGEFGVRINTYELNEDGTILRLIQDGFGRDTEYVKK